MASIPGDLSTPEHVLQAASAAVESPTEVYEALKDQLTPAISFGDTYGSHRFRLVGVNKEKITDGDKAGLVLLSEDCMDQQSAQRSSDNNSGGFADNAVMISTLQAIYDAMDPSWRDIITPVDIPYSTGRTGISTLTNQTLFLPSMWNVGQYYAMFSEKEGECWDYFVETTESLEDPKRVRKRKGSDEAWWLRSGCYLTGASFTTVSASGGRGIGNSSAQYGVVPAFCVYAPAPRILYLAGDTENAPEWIEANTENVFLDEMDSWSKIDGGV